MNPCKKQLKYKPRGTPWPPGVSGNSGGRPKGALNKLSLAVSGGPLAINEQAGLELALSPEPVKFNPNRGHEHTMQKIDGRWWRTIEQDGLIFDRETGVLLA
jgi:hypothetical protein